MPIKQYNDIYIEHTVNYDLTHIILETLDARAKVTDPQAVKQEGKERRQIEQRADAVKHTKSTVQRLHGIGDLTLN